MAEQKFTTSFIPKKQTSAVSSGGRIKKKGSDLFTLVAFVIFITMIVVAVGTFLYKIKLENDIQTQREQIKTASESIDKEFLDEILRLDTRVNSVKRLLDNHLAPSKIFPILEENTYKTLKFNNLSYSINGRDVVLSGSGIAAGFPTIVLQSDAYGDAGLRDVIFSGLGETNGGLVTFSFSAKMGLDKIEYKSGVSGGNNESENEQDSQDDTEQSRGDNVQSSENLENGFMASDNDLINNMEQ